MNNNLFEAWRRRLSWWMIPLVICLINGLGVVYYQIKLAGNVEGLQQLFDAASKTQSDLEARQQESQAFLARVKNGQKSQRTLYEEYFSTPEKRFTNMLREVNRLTTQAGLEPKSRSYPVTSLIGELNRRHVVFSVRGTYNQLRTFINSLELNEQFLTLEQVSLSGSSDKTGSLSIKARISTIFAQKAPRGAS